MAGRQQSHASHREETADRRRPHVPGVITFALGKPVRAKTAGQIAYVNAIESHTITFAIGPAGTGQNLSCRSQSGTCVSKTGRSGASY